MKNKDTYYQMDNATALKMLDGFCKEDTHNLLVDLTLGKSLTFRQEEDGTLVFNYADAPLSYSPEDFDCCVTASFNEQRQVVCFTRGNASTKYLLARAIGNFYDGKKPEEV